MWLEIFRVIIHVTELKLTNTSNILLALWKLHLLVKSFIYKQVWNVKGLGKPYNIVLKTLHGNYDTTSLCSWSSMQHTQICFELLIRHRNVWTNLCTFSQKCIYLPLISEVRCHLSQFPRINTEDVLLRGFSLSNACLKYIKCVIILCFSK